LKCNENSAYNGMPALHMHIMEWEKRVYAESTPDLKRSRRNSKSLLLDYTILPDMMLSE